MNELWIFVPHSNRVEPPKPLSKSKSTNHGRLIIAYSIAPSSNRSMMLLKLRASNYLKSCVLAKPSNNYYYSIEIVNNHL